MLTGLAVGDALGNTSEALVPADRRRRHGELRDYLPNWHADDRRVGLPSDDTQLAFWTIEQMLEDGGLVPDRLAARFASNAACVAFVALLWDALAAHPPVRPGFWLERFIAVARKTEGDTPRYEPRYPRYAGKLTTRWAFTEQVVSEALQASVATAEACNGWYSGAFLLETVPSVLYVLERHGNDPGDAIIRAVNDTRDNDTVAAIVGAAVGALHGLDRLPGAGVRGSWDGPARTTTARSGRSSKKRGGAGASRRRRSLQHADRVDPDATPP